MDSKFLAHHELTEEDCEREVSDSDIVKIASSIHGKWKTQLPSHLGMDPIVVADIVRAPGYIPEEDRRLDFFKKWKQQKGFEATYKTLIIALLEIKCTQDAGKVCKILKEVLQKQASSASDTPANPTASHKQAFISTDTTSSLSATVTTPGGHVQKQTATTSTSTLPSSASSGNNY